MWKHRINFLIGLWLIVSSFFVSGNSKIAADFLLCGTIVAVIGFVEAIADLSVDRPKARKMPSQRKTTVAPPILPNERRAVQVKEKEQKIDY